MTRPHILRPHQRLGRRHRTQDSRSFIRSNLFLPLSAPVWPGPACASSSLAPVDESPGQIYRCLARSSSLIQHCVPAGRPSFVRSSPLYLWPISRRIILFQYPPIHNDRGRRSSPPPAAAMLPSFACFPHFYPSPTAAAAAADSLLCELNGVSLMKTSAAASAVDYYCATACTAVRSSGEARKWSSVSALNTYPAPVCDDTQKNEPNPRTSSIHSISLLWWVMR